MGPGGAGEAGAGICERVDKGFWSEVGKGGGGEVEGGVEEGGWGLNEKNG